MKYLDLLFGDDMLNEENARALFEILVPVLDAAPSQHELIGRTKQVLGRVEGAETLVALVDWWIVVTAGGSPVTAWAYHPPDGIPEPVRQRMVELISVGTKLPAREWLMSRNELAAVLVELPARMDLEFYGKARLGQEHLVWADFLLTAQETTAALLSAEPALAFEFNVSAFERRMHDLEVIKGSQRWNEMLKRAREFTRFTNRLVELQHDVEPWLERPISDPLTTWPELGGEPCKPLEQVLVKSIVSADENAQSTAMRARFHDHLRQIDETADRVKLFEFARLLQPWLDASGAVFPQMKQVVRRTNEVRRALTRFEDLGEDSTDIEVMLLEGDLDGAEELVTVRDQDRAERDHVAFLAREFDRLRRRTVEFIETAGLPTHLIDDARRQLTDADAAANAGDTDSARSTLDATLGRLRSELGVIVDGRLQRLQAEFERLDTVDEFLGRIRELKHENKKDPEIVTRVIDLEASLPNIISARVEQALKRVGDLRDHVIDPTEFSEPTGAELAADIEELRRRLVGLRSSPSIDEFVQANDDLVDLSLEVERRRVHRWSTAQGEPALVEHIVDFCTQELHFEELDVRRLYVALKTKPFAILSGLSGSGKSTIIRLVAEAFGASRANGRFRRIAVRPDWIDQSEVLGFVNPMTNLFQPGWLAEMADHCRKSPDRLHVMVLDEMNLAPVEQYFAEYLSAGEEARSGAVDVELALYPAGSRVLNAHDWPSSIPFPQNLFVVGTVNVDETTRVLSDRVLDRASVLQLSVSIGDDHHKPRRRSARPWDIPYSEWRSVCSSEPSDLHHEFLIDVAEVMKTDLAIGLGIRAHIEIERYIANASGVIDDDVALDAAVLQRIIPKIKGFRRDLVDGLTRLQELFIGAGCTRSARVVAAWLDPKRPIDDFIDGTGAAVGLAL